jgi:transcriptional regulator with XRE-family HTH domain
MLDRLSSNLAHGLRRLREARGLTQQELSDAAGVPRPTLAHLESGNANPTLGVLARVATALGVAMEELVADPRASLTRHPARSLPTREQDGVTLRQLSPGAPAGLTLERFELPAHGRLARGEGRHGDRAYLACERGDVELVAGGEHHVLHAGDVGVVAEGASYACHNRGRTRAVVYLLRLGAARD